MPVTELLNDARARAAEPVRVPWRAGLTGFLVGFLAAIVPAAFVTRMAASQLPMAREVVHGDTALAFAVVIALCVGIAAGVCRAAKAYHEGT